MNKNREISVEVNKQIVIDYINNRLSLNQVAKKYDVSPSYVSNTIHRSGHKTRSVSEGMKQYKIDESFFEKIDTYEKAQVLGFIAADGCLCNPSKYSKAITITLNNKDLNYLEWIKLQLKAEVSIKYIIKNDACSISICNQKICTDIQKLGIHERKSLTHLFPTPVQVLEQFVPAYILGYFEGDGCIHWKRNKQGKLYGIVGICCTKEFGEKLGEYLSRLDIKWKLRIKKEHLEKNINAWSLRIETPQNCCKFFDWIYNSYPSNRVMLRKYNKFKELRNLYDENYNFIQTEEWLKQKSERLAKAGTGRIFSPETREKMRQKAIIREANKKNKII